MQSSPARRLADRDRRAILGTVVFCAAVGGAFSGASPTELPIWDALLCSAFAALVTLAAGRVPRQTLLTFATISAATVGLSVWLLFGLGAALLTIVSVNLRRRDQVNGTVAGALAVQALLRWPPLWFFGFPSLLATLACGFLFWQAYRYSHQSDRQAIRGATAIGLSVVVIGLVGFSFALLSARSDANLGMDAARRGLAEVRDGDTATVEDQMSSAESALTRAADRLSAVWLQPIRLLPVAGQHMRALAVASEQGATVASAARSAVDQVDLSSLSLVAGEIDIDVLTTASPQLRETSDSLRIAQKSISSTSSPWLITPLQRRMEDLLEELDSNIPETELAAEAASVLPGLLGAESPQRYLVLLGNPGESRELGGFVPVYSLVELNNGALRRVESGRISQLYASAREGRLDDPRGYPDLFEVRTPAFWPQNITGLNDIAEVHRAVKDVFPTLAGAPIDGTIYLDPTAIAALLQITGGVSVDGVPAPITAATAKDFLYRDQYELFPESPARFDALLSLVNATFANLTQGRLPGPERLGEVLGPVARAGRLQVAVDDPAASAFLERIFLLRRFGSPPDVDYLSIMQTNAASNKMDIYLQRNLRYQVQLDHAANLTATVRAELVSTVPVDAPSYTLGLVPDDDDPQPVRLGENAIVISLFTPHELASVRVNGDEQLPTRHLESGGWRFTQRVLLPPNETAVVEWDLVGTRAFLDGYELELFNQPLPQDDNITVEIVRPGAAPILTTAQLTEDMVITETGHVLFDS